MNVSSRFGIYSENAASAAYKTRADLPKFIKRNGPLLHVVGDSAYKIFCSL